MDMWVCVNAVRDRRKCASFWPPSSTSSRVYKDTVLYRWTLRWKLLSCKHGFIHYAQLKASLIRGEMSNRSVKKKKLIVANYCQLFVCRGRCFFYDLPTLELGVLMWFWLSWSLFASSLMTPLGSCDFLFVAECWIFNFSSFGWVLRKSDIVGKYASWLVWLCLNAIRMG